MSTYNYCRLSPGCIRLLRLDPHEDEDAPIRCQLFEYSLASATRRGSHLYEALSYCWGSPTKSQTAFTDAGLLQITENLHAALLRLRDPALDRIIWIDAICINQDNLDERGKQVQLMAEIYAKASCVIVWLEYVTGDHLADSESEVAGCQAIRALEAAASRSTEAPSDSVERFDFHRDDEETSENEQEAPSGNEQDRLAVRKLLGRPWFRRIWVVQEVAAARHVLIMCKFAEIEGQAFCSGLDRMNVCLLLEDEDDRSRIRSTVNLIMGATLRSKAVVNNTTERFSLQISSLGCLIELHHIREATDRRDKIYAMLGMSTDTPTGLVPNYQMSWKDLFPHFVKSLLPESLSITTIDEHETALIKIGGCVIGTVNTVEDEGTWEGRQKMKIIPHKSDTHDGDKHDTELCWSLQATAEQIHQGDIVCLLQGMSLPTIVRAHQDYCSIVTIAIDKDAETMSFTESWRRNTQFELLLAWSWKAGTQPSTFNDFLKAQGLNLTSCIPLQIPDDLNTALMLLETGQNYQAILKAHLSIVASEDVDESGYPGAVAVARFLDVAQKGFEIESKRNKSFTMLRNLIGKRRGSVDMTEDFLIQLASADGWEPLAFVLATQGMPATITENILLAALDNDYYAHARDIMELLLDGREDQIYISEKCIRRAIANPCNSMGVTKRPTNKAEHHVSIMNLLFERQGNYIALTEDVITAAAADTRHGEVVMELLLDQRGDQVIITEKVLIAAAENYSSMMELLLERKGGQIKITEKVLLAAATNEDCGQLIMEDLLQWKGGQITITEKVLAAAATNKEISRDILLCLFLRRSDQPTVANQVLKTVYQNLPDSEGRAALHQEMEERGVC